MASYYTSIKRRKYGILSIITCYAGSKEKCIDNLVALGKISHNVLLAIDLTDNIYQQFCPQFVSTILPANFSAIFFAISFTILSAV